MPRPLLFLCCASTSIDYRHNHLSIFHLLEEVPLEHGVPADGVGISLEVVSIWQRLEGEENVTFIQKVDIISPSRDRVASSETEFLLEKPRHRILGRWENVPIKETGEYIFELRIKRLEDLSWEEQPAATYRVLVTRQS